MVKIDETYFSTRKHNVGRAYSEQWVIRGICQETKECFLYAVPNKFAGTLMATITKCILSDTAIVSDLWWVYNANH